MIFLRLLDWIIWLLPSRLTLFFGRMLGTFIYKIDRRHRDIALSNLKEAYPAYTLLHLKKIAKGAFQHLVLLGLEILILSRKSPLKWREKVFDEGLEHLEEARLRQKSILFLTGHVGNWEILAMLGRWAGFIESVIARNPTSKKMQHWIDSIRRRYGVQVIGKGQLRYIIEEFKHQRTVGALIDQDAGRRGTFVPFFGRLASTPTGVIRLGLKAGVPILPAFSRRISDRLEYRLWIGEDLTKGLENLPLREKEKKVLERFTQALERFVREDPSQWLWLHRRWKTRPSQEMPRPRKKALFLTDGKAGHFNQLLGISRGLDSWEKNFCLIEFKSRFHRAWVYGMALCSISSIRLLRWALLPSSRKDLPIWAPSVILACGGTTATAAYVLKHYYGSKTVVLMRSAFWQVEKMFDLAILPLHDKPKKRAHVIQLLGSPSIVTQDLLYQASIQWVERLKLGSGRKIGVLVGGDSPRQKMGVEVMKKAVEFLQNHKGEYEILLATSRRTPKIIEHLIRDALEGQDRVHLLWVKDNPDNPIPGILGISDVVLVTEDSFSMLMEAIHSGRPVISLRLSLPGWQSLKYEETLCGLEKEGRLIRSSPEGLEKSFEMILRKGSFSKKVNNPETEQAVKAVLNLMGEK
ncbi:MAG: mitochondrial fission ELM1 family protein [Chlamydiae bacterium]|nr:mitochondrial fission ELM1 family protein [Chlamydiota bacterium]MBI3265962.1 mitochondrial fission ELM1 family protein [Chlamydiota bacterium]